MCSMDSVSLSLQCPHECYISCSSKTKRLFALEKVLCNPLNKDIKSLVGKFSPIGKLMLLLQAGWVHVGHRSWSCQFPKAQMSHLKHGALSIDFTDLEHTYVFTDLPSA